MPNLTRNRAAWIAGGVAVLVYLLALRNGWAGDDMVVIRDNPATKSVGAALRAWFEPYWPGEFRWAGLYRPLTILSYGVDWTIAGGATWWFHLVNAVLHGAAVFLVVSVAAVWLAPVGALAAGLVFAVHPVHVEAVANTVGRAEILVAIGILASVLAARRYRQATTARRRRLWLAATVAAAALAMASKEHGIISVAVIALDDLICADRHRAEHVPLYVGLVGVTLVWLFLWRGIAGAYTIGSGHAALVTLTPAERMATMLPVYLDVLRLLAWPFRLASDYSPQVTSLRTGFGGLAGLGLAASAAALALGVLCARRAPAVSFGVLAAAASYLPTANVFFVSGVVLGERNLYFAVLAPALAIGWILERALQGRHARVVLLCAGAVALAFVLKTADREPFWRDAQTPVAEEQTAHPENYQTRVVLARHLAALGDSSWALAELLVAGELLPTEPRAALLASEYATTQGRRRIALREASRAYGMLPTEPDAIERMVRSLGETGKPDSALVVAAAGVDGAPAAAPVFDLYAAMLGATGAEPWRTLVIKAAGSWLRGDLALASAQLDSAWAVLPLGPLAPTSCADVRRVLATVRALKPRFADRLTRAGGSESTACRFAEARS